MYLNLNDEENIQFLLPELVFFHFPGFCFFGKSETLECYYQLIDEIEYTQK